MVLLGPLVKLGLLVLEALGDVVGEGETSCEGRRSALQLGDGKRDQESSPRTELPASLSFNGFCLVTNLPFLSSTRAASSLAAEGVAFLPALSVEDLVAALD